MSPAQLPLCMGRRRHTARSIHPSRPEVNALARCCVLVVVASALENEYTTIIIADHGNCETMMNPDGTPHTAHTTNPVPIILVDPELKTIKDGILGDLAPTILKLMGVEKSPLMTRHSLV